MCCIENLKAQIAKEDINVYKVVRKADKESCVSLFIGYTYYKNSIHPSRILEVRVGSSYSFAEIKELQKQRDLLKKDVTVLECKINELRDILELKNIKKGYYTNNLGLFCKVYDIKGDNIHVYELDTTDLLSLTKETYYWRSFEETYYKKCTKEEYDKALDKIVKHFKS